MIFTYFFKDELEQIASILNSKCIFQYAVYLNNPFENFRIIQICLHLPNERHSYNISEEKASTAFQNNMEKPLNQNSF